MLKTLPYLANQVSVHPPLSQMRMGATLLMVRRGGWGGGMGGKCIVRLLVAHVDHVHEAADN